MAQKQARSQETTEAILRAAVKLGATKEIADVTIRDICTAAGVSVGAFYHHFSSREEMFRRAFETFDAELSRSMKRRIENKPPMEALNDLLLFQVSFVANDGRNFVSNYYRTALSSPSQQAVNPNRSYYVAAYTCAQRLAEEGLLLPAYSPKQVAEICITFIRGCLIDWCLHDQNYDVVAHVKQILPILFYGFVEDNRKKNEISE